VPQTAELKPADREHAMTSFLADTPAMLIGEAAGWFDLDRQGSEVVLRPHRPLPRRCTIRPAALFEHERGFIDANIVMGRLVFPNASSQPQRYRPFTRDPQRAFRELYFPVETMPEDDQPNSVQRWSNCQAVAKRLLAAVDIPWSGLSRVEIEQLVRCTLWSEPLDGCLLHALAQWTHDRGQCVIEIGSFRGRSATMMAMALRGLGSSAPLVSIDPHLDQPHNHDHIRLALRQIGEEERLVQFRCPSDRACRYLRPAIASLIFIDGDHADEQVTADFHNYLDLLAPGGCLLFHDYGCGDHNGLPDTNPGVRRAVDKQVFPHPDLHPLLLAHTLIAFTKHS
jgi:predicted O-methyltransferase YrrM